MPENAHRISNTKTILAGCFAEYAVPNGTAEGDFPKQLPKVVDAPTCPATFLEDQNIAEQVDP